jgi:hypothetical protein
MTTTMPAMVEEWAALLSDGVAAPADVAALEDLLQRISTPADEIPEIAELHVNPVIVGTDAVVTVNAKIRVAPVGSDHDPQHDPLLRRLR